MQSVRGRGSEKEGQTYLLFAASLPKRFSMGLGQGEALNRDLRLVSVWVAGA